MCKVFKEKELTITVECDIAITDFLDVTCNLRPVT